MNRFGELVAEVERAKGADEKVAALERYFRETPSIDAAWALFFLTGRRLIRAIPGARLREWAGDASGLPLWLIEESYRAVGDLGETLALLSPNHPTNPMQLHELIDQRIRPIRTASEKERRELVTQTWRQTDTSQRQLFNRLISGGLRVSVGRSLIVQALAKLANVEPAIIGYRLMRDWQPTTRDFERLLVTDSGAAEPARPYPFLHANPLTTEPQSLGAVDEWLAEYKWDGIRAQLIVRGDQVRLWSRSEQFISDTFPEIVADGRRLPDGTVLDGVILASETGRPVPLVQLQQRIDGNRGQPRLWDELPVVFMVHDLIESEGIDRRSESTTRRLKRLERVASATMRNVLLSPPLAANSWDELAGLRAAAATRGAEGLTLKRRSAAYGVGPVHGVWWSWKDEPHRIDTVLMFAQHGEGKYAGLFTDYTLGVWSNGELLPVAKVQAGLSDDDIARVDRFVRNNSQERLGPLRAVKPELVFELVFEGVQESRRRKAGVALRHPRIARWREDKKAGQADSLQLLRRLTQPTEQG